MLATPRRCGSALLEGVDRRADVQLAQIASRRMAVSKTPAIVTPCAR